MRLAYVDPHAVPDVRPATLQILHTVDALATVGVQVDLITPRPRGGPGAADLLAREPAAGLRFDYLPDPRRRWWFPSSSNQPFYFMARRRLLRAGYDAVLVRNLKLADYLLRRPLPMPLFFETHEIFAQSFREQHATLSWSRRRKLAALERREALVYGRARGIVGITRHLLDDVAAHYGVATPGLVAPDGFDPHLAESAAIPPRAAQTPPVLLYLGSLHPWKGVETLIGALALLPAVRLRIAGGSAPRIEALRRQAEAAGCGERVEFMGQVAPARRFEVIAQADICLLPLADTSIGSRYTSPLKLFEYMAMGKPIIVSDLPAIREVVTQDASALLVPPGEPAAIAAAVRRLLDDAALAARLGDTARRLAWSAYSWTARARQMAAFMQQACGGQT